MAEPGLAGAEAAGVGFVDQCGGDQDGDENADLGEELGRLEGGLRLGAQPARTALVEVARGRRAGRVSLWVLGGC